MNYMLYAKSPTDRQFGAMNLQQGTYHVGLMYASLVSDLQRAIQYADVLAARYPSYQICVRPAGKTRTVYTPAKPKADDILK